MKKNLEKVTTMPLRVEKKVKMHVSKVWEKVCEDNGNWVEEGLKYVIAIVIGGVLLAGLTAIFKADLLTGIKKGITDLFNYKG